MDERWQQIERIYHAARELDENARAEFLAKACAGDDDLRCEVESLLEHESQAGSFLETSPLELVAKDFFNHEHSLSSPDATLETGFTIAHYWVLEKIGEGGMGEVYRARDTKLQRDVALKILPQAMAKDAQRMARFEREAHVLASLNHPNIASIYGLEESNGVRALVMELVEGETLADKIAGEGTTLPREPKGLPCQDALPMAKQIAEALEYAHERGVIHRDLKPANVKITPEGTVKVLDFGLAKAVAPGFSPAGADAGLKDGTEDSTTLATQPGMILGTAAYMSPEQAKGHRVDRRCDIWAFGCVLFEMLAGRKAFEGETIPDVLAAVLTKGPDWKELPEATPQAVLRLIHRSLVKDPKQRLRDIGDARITIEETLWSVREMGLKSAHPMTSQEGPGTMKGGSDSQAVAPMARRHTKTLLAGLTAVVAIAMILIYWLLSPLPAPRVSGFVQLTHDAVFKYMVGTDGSRIYLYEKVPGSNSLLAQVSVAGGDVVPIPTPSPTIIPTSVSADGSRFLAVDTAGSSLDGPFWILPTLGGSPHRLAGATGHFGAWSPEGKKFVYVNGSDLFSANADGTNPFRLASMQGDVYPPVWSPDGKIVRFTVSSSANRTASIWQVSADGTNLHQILPGWDPTTVKCCGSWTPDGNYFVFISNGQIWARRETGTFLRKVTRNPVQLTTGAIAYTGVLPSRDGKKLFAVMSLPRGELDRYNPEARTFEPYLGGISAQDLAFSKDGQWVAYVSYPEGTLWRSRVDGSDKLQLSFPPLYAQGVDWSPDGKEIVFSDIGGANASMANYKPSRIYLVSADGGTPRELIPHARRPHFDGDWSPDGASIALSWDYGTPDSVVRIFDIKTHRVSTLPGSQGSFSPRWSPDGRHLLAMTNDLQSLRVYDFRTREWSLLARGIMGYPYWSGDGRYVYFLRWPLNPAIFRVGVQNRKVEVVTSLKEFKMTGYWNNWMGHAPDDSPLVLKDVGTQEVVSMDWIAP